MQADLQASYASGMREHYKREIGKEIFVEDTQLRGESGPSDKRSAKNKNSFISHVFTVLRFLGGQRKARRLSLSLSLS